LLDVNDLDCEGLTLERSLFERTIIMGNILSDLQEVWDNQFPPKPLWAVDQVPDLTGKVKFSASELTN